MNKSIRDAIERDLNAAKAIADRVVAENRNFTGEERAEVDGHIKSAREHRERGEGQDTIRKELAELTDGLGGHEDGGPAGEPQAKAPQAQALRSKGAGSLGAQFVKSNEYQALLKSVPGGRFGEKATVQSQPYAVKSLITALSETSAGSLVNPQQLGLLDPFYQRPLTVRQLITSGRTETDTIEYVKLVSVTNNAAPVAEATSTGVIGTGDPVITAAAGGLKPESGMVFAKASAPVRTLAHWIPVTKRALSDAGQVQTLIDAFLLYGLEEEVEDQILTGDGEGENFLGISATTGIQTQAAPSGALTTLDTTRMARRKVRIGGRTNPTAYVFNPLDWEAIELMKDANERYYGAGPFAMTTPTLWGLPVVESEAIPAGTAYVADWRMAVLWDREQASIQATSSHADFFIRNLVAILAEMRAGFGVLRPSAFVQIALAT